MAEIVSTGTPTPDDLKQNFFKNLWEDIRVLDRGMKFTIFAGIFLIIFGVYAANNILETRQRASGESLAKVEIHPGVINTSENAINTGVSALAYDFSGNPIRGAVYYEWGTSSTNSVGTLTKVTGDITEYDPLKSGCGEVHVIVRLGDKSVTKSIQVTVQPGDGTGPKVQCETTSPTPPQAQILQLYAVADSYVRSNQATKNFGSSNILWADSNPRTLSFFRFNLSQLAGKEILNAKLRLRVPNETNAQSGGDFRISSTSASWKEGSLTYKNMPPINEKIGSFSGPIKKSQSVESDLTSWVIANSGKTVSLVIEGLSSDDGAFRSSEAQSASNRPVLIIEYR